MIDVFNSKISSVEVNVNLADLPWHCVSPFTSPHMARILLDPVVSNRLCMICIKDRSRINRLFLFSHIL